MLVFLRNMHFWGLLRNCYICVFFVSEREIGGPSVFWLNWNFYILISLIFYYLWRKFISRTIWG